MWLNVHQGTPGKGNLTAERLSKSITKLISIRSLNVKIDGKNIKLKR